MRNSIFYSALTDENGNILVDENGNKLLAEIGITDTEVFQNLTQAYMPKNEKIIKDIIIQIDDDITVEQLSEGEKKLILVKTVLEILSDEKTLVLMDEPDAHLHEGRKPALCNMMREYPNRQIVIATHSPIMAQIANEKELLMLELENGKSTILTDEKIEKIKKLSGTSWDVIGQGMMLRSSRPLVVFEGKTDVMYVKRALEMLKSRVTDYASLNVDFLNANGAGNVKSFIDNLMFKALGLLDDNGQPLQRYYEFLDQTQTGRIIAIGIEEAYEDLFNLRKDAQNLTNDEVKNKLKTITQGQKSDKILGLMAMTFRAFCDLADWDSVGTEETNKIETPHVVLKSDNTEKSQTKTDPTTTDMNLHYNIQIHLPETTNMAVYDAIFQSLKKHLM